MPCVVDIVVSIYLLDVVVILLLIFIQASFSLHLLLIILDTLGKTLITLLAHHIDDEFKLAEICIFSNPVSDVDHTAWEIEKAIKTD